MAETVFILLNTFLKWEPTCDLFHLFIFSQIVLNAYNSSSL